MKNKDCRLTRKEYRFLWALLNSAAYSMAEKDIELCISIFEKIARWKQSGRATDQAAIHASAAEPRKEGIECLKFQH